MTNRRIPDPDLYWIAIRDLEFTNKREDVFGIEENTVFSVEVNYDETRNEFRVRFQTYAFSEMTHTVSEFSFDDYSIGRSSFIVLDKMIQTLSDEEYGWLIREIETSAYSMKKVLFEDKLRENSDVTEHAMKLEKIYRHRESSEFELRNLDADPVLTLPENVIGAVFEVVSKLSYYLETDIAPGTGGRGPALIGLFIFLRLLGEVVSLPNISDGFVYFMMAVVIFLLMVSVLGPSGTDKVMYNILTVPFRIYRYFSPKYTLPDIDENEIRKQIGFSIEDDNKKLKEENEALDRKFELICRSVFESNKPFCTDVPAEYEPGNERKVISLSRKK